MTSRTDISNQILAAIGCPDRISAPEDDSKPARELRNVWDDTRREALRGGNWNCATIRAALAALVLGDGDNPTADQIFPFTYAYQLPADCLRFRDLVDDSIDPADYQIERGLLLTKWAGPARIRYIIDVPDPSQWDAAFVAAFVQLGGFKVADNLTGDRARKVDCWNSWKELSGEAKAVDALENPPEDQAEDPWILARYGC